MTIAIGQPAPDFTLPTDGNGTVTLSALRGRTVIVYFYPKDDTTGCTAQACGFGEQLPGFQAVDATIIGISKDSVASHDKFKAKYKLPFTLASDKDGDTVERYESWVEKNMYGRTYMGIDRSTFLIDKDGTIRAIWRKVKVKGHVEAVLKAVQEL